MPISSSAMIPSIGVVFRCGRGREGGGVILGCDFFELDGVIFLRSRKMGGNGNHTPNDTPEV